MKSLGMILSSAALVGCGGSSDAGQPAVHQSEREPVHRSDNDKSKEAEGKVVVVPAFVQKMLDAEFPADGKLHVQSRGRFVVRSRTLFCYGQGGGVNGSHLVKALERLGQSDYVNGSVRHRPIDPNHCEPNSGHVTIVGTQNLNRDGKPYKLTLAAWQGGAAWVGVIERVEGGPRAKIFNPYNTDPLQFEIIEDGNRLSLEFTNQL